MSEIERIRSYFENDSPFAQGAALYEIQRQADIIAALEAENADLRSGAYLASVVEERDRLRKALDGAFCVLLLDGRNEHGSHVLSGYPRSFEVNDEDLSEQAEAILSEGEKLGFPEGSLVWAEFSWVSPQIGDEGRVELDGYWDFSGINPELSAALEAKP